MKEIKLIINFLKDFGFIFKFFMGLFIYVIYINYVLVNINNVILTWFLVFSPALIFILISEYKMYRELKKGDFYE